ncbi:MAG: ATP-dependent zinc metalloprotease FtsH [Candidatus Kerfeldbacteria bacterium]|nr:ATP-dependent zinc metalloprotease FtsH [Candidatus Kerfeldbacteria bacterium]
MNPLLKNAFLILVIFALILTTLSFFSSPTPRTQISLDKLIQQINDEQVKEIIVNENTLEVVLVDGTLQAVRKEPTDSFSQLMSNYGVAPEKLLKVNVTIKDVSGAQLFRNVILPFLLPFLLIAGFIWLVFRNVQGQNMKAMSFGQSQAREVERKTKTTSVTFADVAGSKEAKEELTEVVDFLRNPRKFLGLGARIPKGVLLLGPPGTGKTLLAKAVAGEADVPFFSISGSEFVEMFVGVGASRVRDLFRKAKRAAPCIVFVDEIDAVGRQRGAGLGGSHDEREQTLNQILVEMDGFDTDTNVIIIAATNRPDILDPALLRPGRFDRRVVLELPDLNEREDILKVHAKEKPLETTVDLRRIAERTPGMSGADLSNLLNEAALLAARRDKKVISLTECFESIEKVMLGPERKSRLMSKKEKKIAAVHEAGHALVAHLSPHADPVHKVSIVSRGLAAGYTLKIPSEDRRFHSRSEFLDDLAVMVAGHAAEKHVFKDLTTGASNDLLNATSLARSIVTEYGMSPVLGPRTFGQKDEMIFLGREIHERRDYSEKVAEQIDAEVTKLIKHAYTQAEKLIADNGAKLNAIVGALLEKETLEKEEFEKVVAAA